MYCKYCGESIDEDSIFCRFCGRHQGIICNTEDSYKKPIPTTGIANGHEWVDLGLSVKWATCNIGAKDSTDKGYFFAWGETETKDFFSEDEYKLNGILRSYKKVGNDIAGTKYDAATVNWGGFWRMPTKEEMLELIESCSWEWINKYGVEGCIVSRNNNTIFLPYTKMISGRGGMLGNCSGSYWTSTLTEDESSYAWGLLFFGSDFQKLDDLKVRYCGLLIRPVYDDKY